MAGTPSRWDLGRQLHGLTKTRIYNQRVYLNKILLVTFNTRLMLVSLRYLKKESRFQPVPFLHAANYPPRSMLHFS